MPVKGPVSVTLAWHIESAVETVTDEHHVCPAYVYHDVRLWVLFLAV